MSDWEFEKSKSSRGGSVKITQIWMICERHMTSICNRLYVQSNRSFLEMKFVVWYAACYVYVIMYGYVAQEF